MPQIKNVMEIFQLLDKSNCRECNAPTCLAFAAAVFNGQRGIEECPHLDAAIIARYQGKVEKPKTVEDRDEMLALLKDRIAKIDLIEAARRLDADYRDHKLTLKILGKDFSVDQSGTLSSDIHIHPWIAIPFLDYVGEGDGKPASGEWVPFRELKKGKTWYRLFEQRCEKPLKVVADTYTDLFEDMVRLFNGRQVERHYAADISLVLHPLPKVPLLICYWKPEDGLESSLNIFFDKTAEDNLNIESLFTLGTGLVMMFEKIARRHGLS